MIKFKKVFKESIKKLFEKKIKNWSYLRTLEIELTTKCNNNCSYCGNSSESSINPFNLDFNEIKTLMDSTHEKGILPDVISLAGGDPFLHPDFMSFVSLFANLDISFYVKANTSSFTEKIGNLLLKNKCSLIKFTCFGDSKLHDSLRGFDTYSSLIEKTLLANKMGFTVVWNMMISSDSIEQTFNSLKKAVEINVSGVTFSRVADIGRNFSGQQKKIEPKKYRDFLLKALTFYQDNMEKDFHIFFKEKLWLTLLHELGMVSLNIELLKNPVHGCEAYGHALTITPDGYFLPCGLLRNLNMGSINEVNVLPWPRARKYLDYAGPSPCRKCKYQKYCRGCAAMGIPDPQCWLISNE